MDRHRKSQKLEKGQSMVEFAFSLVILLIVLAGIVDVGRALFTYMALRDAAQEGALYASIHPTQITAIENRVFNSSDMVQDMASELGEEPLAEGEEEPVDQIEVDVDILGAPCSGHGVEVTVSYHDFVITMPFLGTFIGKQEVDITASVVDTILSPSCD
jgi:hypothetical protein